MGTIFRDILICPRPVPLRIVVDQPPNLLVTTLVVTAAPFPSIELASPIRVLVRPVPQDSINLLVTTLATPLVSFDLPNPKRSLRFVADVPANLLVNYAVPIAPFAPVDFGVQRPASRVTADTPQNLLLTTLVVGAPPFVPVDTASPIRVLARPQAQAPENLLVTTLAVPFAPYDSFIPKQTKRALVDLQSVPLPMLYVTPFVPIDFLVPKKPSLFIPDEPMNLLGNTLYTIPASPFFQPAFPIVQMPKVRRPAVVSQDSWSIALFVTPLPAPSRIISWAGLTNTAFVWVGTTNTGLEWVGETE